MDNFIISLQELSTADLVSFIIATAVTIKLMKFATNIITEGVGFPDISDVISDFFDGIFSKFKKKPEHSVYYNEHYNGFFEEDYNEKYYGGEK